MKDKLNVIVVWYNEEVNLPKFFESIKNFDGKIDYEVIYCDQESTDNSLKIAKKYWATIYKHPKYWICETSRIRTVNEHVKEDEWVLFLDADEEVSDKLTKEMTDRILSHKYDICIVPINVYFMKLRSQTLLHPRLFKKWAVELHDVAHHWHTLVSDRRIKLKNKVLNIDLKGRWCEISNYLEKLNRYTNNEVEKIESISKIKLFYWIFIKPIIWFFWFWIWWWYFFKWMSWWILAYYNSAYEFFKWAKVYEKLCMRK